MIGYLLNLYEDDLRRIELELKEKRSRGLRVESDRSSLLKITTDEIKSRGARAKLDQ